MLGSACLSLLSAKPARDGSSPDWDMALVGVGCALTPEPAPALCSGGCIVRHEVEDCDSLLVVSTQSVDLLALLAPLCMGVTMAVAMA